MEAFIIGNYSVYNYSIMTMILSLPEKLKLQNISSAWLLSTKKKEFANFRTKLVTPKSTKT